MKWLELVTENFRLRPIWMNGLLIFCAYMTFFYVPWDMLFKPVADAQEVWFGYLLTGWSARLTEPLHLMIYGAGTIGFWKMKYWMHPWAGVYTAQVALGMLVWSASDERGGGLLTGLLVAVPFVVLAFMLWRARHQFKAAS